MAAQLPGTMRLTPGQKATLRRAQEADLRARGYERIRPRLFHRHRWVEAGRYFQPGVGIVQAKGVMHHDYERLVYGFTSVELRCDSCGDRRVKEFTGKVGKDKA